MNYIVGDKITSKKPHACGDNNWTVVRVGADVKLKCDKCGHTILVTYEKMEKMTKRLKREGE